MTPSRLLVLSALALALFGPRAARAHCEIPCGIYDDQLRAGLLAEHITTIEKSIKQVTELNAAKTVDYHQLVRWVTNKEDHADKLQEIVQQYFMTQRLKPTEPTDKVAYAKFIEELTLLHGMLVYGMKAKQGTDLANVAKLRDLLQRFNASYFASPAR